MTEFEQALFNELYISGLQLVQALDAELGRSNHAVKLSCLLWLLKCVSDQYLSAQDIILAHEMAPDWEDDCDRATPWHDCEFMWQLESMAEDLKGNAVDGSSGLKSAVTAFAKHLNRVEAFSNSIWESTRNIAQC